MGYNFLTVFICLIGSSYVSNILGTPSDNCAVSDSLLATLVKSVQYLSGVPVVHATNNTTRNITVCEHDNALLICPSGSNVSITYADYGRQNSTVCAERHDQSATEKTDCTSIKELGDRSIADIVLNGCQNTTSLSFCMIRKVANQVFGEPCAGTYKYLSLSFTCVV